VWARLRDAGGVLLGKLNTQEFALGNATMPTVNPWNTAHTPGGSSGGSAAALSSRFVLAASGSDTAGSIRIPSSACGVVGLKPTYGRVSRHGVITLSWSMDTAGMLARSVADVAFLTGLVAGHDPADPTSRDVPVPAYPTMAPRDLRGVRVGIPTTYFWDAAATQADILAVCRGAVRRLQDAGATVVDVDLPPAFAEAMAPAPLSDPQASPLLLGQSHPALLITTEAFGYHEALIAQRGVTTAPTSSRASPRAAPSSPRTTCVRSSCGRCSSASCAGSTSGPTSTSSRTPPCARTHPPPPRAPPPTGGC